MFGPRTIKDFKSTTPSPPLEPQSSPQKTKKKKKPPPRTQTDRQHVQLGRNPHLLAREITLTQSTSNVHFVAVRRGGVDVAISQSQRRVNYACDGRFGKGKCAETDGGEE